MANKAYEKNPNIISVQEMQSKTPVRYHQPTEWLKTKSLTVVSVDNDTEQVKPTEY